MKTLVLTSEAQARILKAAISQALGYPKPPDAGSPIPDGAPPDYGWTLRDGFVVKHPTLDEWHVQVSARVAARWAQLRPVIVARAAARGLDISGIAAPATVPDEVTDAPIIDDEGA